MGPTEVMTIEGKHGQKSIFFRNNSLADIRAGANLNVPEWTPDPRKDGFWPRWGINNPS